MDTIFISELKLDALIGIYAWEHQIAQAIQLDLELSIDAARSAQTGRISDTVDYAQVVRRIREVVSARHYALLEKLAEDIAAMILAEFGTTWVRLSIAKLAPVPGVRKLGVRIERGAVPARN